MYGQKRISLIAVMCGEVQKVHFLEESIESTIVLIITHDPSVIHKVVFMKVGTLEYKVYVREVKSSSEEIINPYLIE